VAFVPDAVSDYALAELRRVEGAIPYVYDDQGGRYPPARLTSFTAVKGFPTIGVGHRIYAAEQAHFAPYLAGGEDLPSEQINALLREDIEQRVAKTLRPKIQRPISQSMWDALVLQAFNTGPNTSAMSRTVAAINAGDYDAAVDALASGATTSKGKTLEGLVRRRQAEVQLFLRGLEEDVVELVTQPWVWALAGGFTLVGAIALLKLYRIKRGGR
jgi:GH24 family phage-related lysozyme (muramidase)